MKHLLWLFLMIISLAGLSVPAYSQDESTFALLTEKYTLRPLTMHKGQFQFNSGYSLSILNHKYDSRGTILDLRKDGTVAVKHQFPFGMKFGVFEFLQLTTDINYSRMGLRSQNINVLGYTALLDKDELIEYRGFNDLYLGIDLHSPFGLKFLDIVLSGGIYLPVFNHKPDEPEHTYLEYGPDTAQLVDLNYHFINKFSKGVQCAVMGGALKYKSRKLSVSGSFRYIQGLEDAESIYWSAELSGGFFNYYQNEYSYNIGQMTEWSGEIAYQPIDWLALFVTSKGYQVKNAWEMITVGKKSGVLPESMISAGIGYEVHVSPLLRLTQFINYPVSGKNSLGSFLFMTGLSLNIISSGYFHAF